MAITPINITRVSHNLRTFSLLDSLRRNTLALFTQQTQLASGSRINAPSDDPVMASRALKLTRVLEEQDQLLDNIRFADGFLSAIDSAVGQVNDLLIQAHTLASENVGSLTDEQQRETAAELVEGIIARLITIGNQQYQDIYLFNGRKGGIPPFVADSKGVLYRGDEGELKSRVDRSGDVSFNVTGGELFGALSGEVRGTVDLDPALTAGTRLIDMNGANGVGVRLGSIQIEESGGAGVFVVDLSEADTVGDVIDMINDASSSASATITASLTTNGIQLTSGGFDIGVRELGSGKTASDLGILQDPPAASPLVGADLDPRVVSRTLLSDLNGGAGVSLINGVIVTNGLLSETIDLSSANTVQDVLNLINGADVAVEAQINADGMGIDVLSRFSGADLRIGENGGTDATQLGIRSMYGDTLLADMNHGKGVATAEGENDIRVVAKDGGSFEVDLSGAVTVQDVIDAINVAAAGAGVAVTASLALTGNGIRLVDATGGTGDLRVERAAITSYAVDDLGLNKSVADPATELVGDDVHGVRPDGLFSALVALRDALLQGDQGGITEAGWRLGELTSEVARAHGMVGARSQAMHARAEYTEDAVLATRALLSEVKDLDYVEAITRFQQAQMALQANLMSGAQLLSISLLDFLR